MTPNEDLVHYIEDELYKGVPIADVLYAVRNAGWSERQIQDAMTLLDRQHEAMLLDSTPQVKSGFSIDSLSLPSFKKFRFDQFNWRLGLFTMGLTAVAILLIAGIVKVAHKSPSTPTQQLNDPNFSISIPQNWQVDPGYKPGSRMLFVRSPEDSSPEAYQKIALMTIYPDAELDVFGKQLQTENADVELIRNETTKSGSIRVRFIEFKTRDAVGDGNITHGEYVFVDKGFIKMSAMITAREQYWPTYAVAAEKALRTFMPECSRESSNATKNADGTFYVCGNPPLQSTSSTSKTTLPD